jgi:predicted Ser/Thr protein kinase
LSVPERIGGHRVDRLLGAGGHAEVYLATDERLNRAVAIKLLAADADGDARSRFVREGQALARLQHPHVVQVLAAGDDDGRAYMVLQYIDGSSLADLMAGRSLDEETACGLLAQAARGLAAVHAIGVVHRDVKPDNILVDDDADVKLADFGTAVGLGLGHDGFRTKEGFAVGTPHYMAPEQARGQAADARTDLWGLGATLFAALTGRPPFFGGDDEPDVDILARIVSAPAVDVRTLAPAVSAATAELVRQLLSMERADRPPDAAQVADTLDACGRRAGELMVRPDVLRRKTRQRQVIAVVAASMVATLAFIWAIDAQTRSAKDVAVPAVVDVPKFVVVDADADANDQPTNDVAFDVVVHELIPTPTPTVVQRYLDKPTSSGARLVLGEPDDAQRQVWQTGGVAGRLWTMAAVQDRRSLDLVEDAALHGSAKATNAVIDGLKAVRNDLSIQLLAQISRTHADGAVRRRALAAKDELFRVED